MSKYDLSELVCCGTQGSRVTKGNTFLNTCIGKCCTIVMSANKILINNMKNAQGDDVQLSARHLRRSPLRSSGARSLPWAFGALPCRHRKFSNKIFRKKMVDFKHYRSLFSSTQTFNILQPCLAAGLFTISLGWTENYGSQTGSLVEKYRQAC